MAVFTIQVSERALAMLQDEYRRLQSTASVAAPLPAFEDWLAKQDLVCATSERGRSNDIGLFKLIEDLVTGLQPTGYTLIQHAAGGTSEATTGRLAQLLGTHFDAPDFYLKRINDLLNYYQKPVDQVAGSVRQEEVERLASNMLVAFRELLKRSEKALDHLSEDRAIGRIEGAVAMLVSGGVMTRADAQQQAATFKKVVRLRKVRQ